MKYSLCVFFFSLFLRTLAYLSPKNVTALSAGELIFDLGQNFAGWCILDTLVAPAGTTVVIKHAEVLQKGK